MLVIDVNTVNILGWLTTVVNIILYALIIFVIVTWVKQKDRKSQKDKTENN